MNPRERLLTTLRGGVADRVPLALEGLIRAAVDPDAEPTSREITERILDQTHYWRHWPTHGNRYLMTPSHRIREISSEERNGEVTIASRIDTPKGPLTAVVGRNTTSRTTWTLKYPVESLDDIRKIRSVPWELPEGLGPADFSDAPPDFAARGVTRVGVSSPFVCVAGMMPYERFLELCATRLDLIKELTRICLDRTLSALDVVLSKRNVEYVWMGGSEWVTPPMASPRIYEELVQNFERPVIERIHAAGALCHVHCHGNVRSTLEMAIERGADFFEPVEPPPDGDITFAEAKALADGRITLGGNIEMRVLECGAPDEVERAARAAFEGGKKRMVLKPTAGPIGAITPAMLANYLRMIDVWEELSPIEG